MKPDPVLRSHPLAAGPLELEYLEDAGPRIVGLRYKGSANLLASVPEISIPTPYGDYHYLGGHRLWYAPEAMPRSYIPDEDGLTVSELPDGIVLQGKREPGTGIRKSIKIQIRLSPARSQVLLTHTLVNEGLWEVELAPWAITMFRLGGVAVLPFQSERVDMDDLLPNRQIALWPYSSINDSRLRFDNDFILVSAMADLPLFKIGTFNPRGWICYWNEGVLFRKTFTVQAGKPHPDHGCNAEIYCDEHFIELESIAPLVRLEAGASVSHTETWELSEGLENDFLPERIVAWMR
jgi:hypothetical protein